MLRVCKSVLCIYISIKYTWKNRSNILRRLLIEKDVYKVYKQCDPGVLTMYLLASYLVATRHIDKSVERVLKERRWRIRKFCNRFAICIHFSFNARRQSRMFIIVIPPFPIMQLWNGQLYRSSVRERSFQLT